MLLYTSTPLQFRGKYCTFSPLHLFDNFSYVADSDLFMTKYNHQINYDVLL